MKQTKEIEVEVNFDNLENKICTWICVNQELCPIFMKADRNYENEYCFNNWKCCNTYLTNMKDYQKEKK